jgi:hypothetical protein
MFCSCCPLWIIRDRAGQFGELAHVRFAPKGDATFRHGLKRDIERSQLQFTPRQYVSYDRLPDAMGPKLLTSK